MKIATLVLVTRTNGGVQELLLARKKEGEIGIGFYSPPGGKVEKGETLETTCVRETLEEMGFLVDERALTELAVLDVHRAVLTGYEEGALPPEDSEEALDSLYEPFMRVFVFQTENFSGEPRETSDMEQPHWWRTDALPYDAMYCGDKHWMKHLLCEKPLKRRFVVYRYNGVFRMMESHALLPFNELMET